MRKIISLILAVLMLVSVVPLGVSASDRWDVINAKGVSGDDIVAQARTYLGVPYIQTDNHTLRTGYGDPMAFDCSGFVYRVCRDVGLTSSRANYSEGKDSNGNYYITAHTQEQRYYGEDISTSVQKYIDTGDYSELKAGDLLFITNNNSSVSHVVIYSGNGTIVHSEGGIGVSEHPIDRYHSNKNKSNWYFAGCRLVEDEIQTGDIIELGSYLGETITWICVDVDENGPLMLSRDVLCNKQYDAAGTDSNYHNDGWGYIRKNYGSNCWYDSNIRQWLNSSGTVEYTHCPPTYSNEDGFMSNFSEAELACVKEVTQKTYVNSWETNRSGYVNGGTREVPDVTTVAGLDRDYSYYWYQNVTDSFFLLGQEQLSRIYENDPSYVYNDASYYTRIAGNSGASYEHTFVVFGENTIGASRSSSSNGIRPAFYLDVDKYNSSTNTPSTPQTCKHINSVNQPQINSNCIDIGFTAGVYCNDCATWLSGHDVIAVGDHKDNTGDGKCDTCLKQLSTPSEPEQPKKNIVQKVVDAVKNAFNNFINFFKKLFGR